MTEKSSLYTHQDNNLLSSSSSHGIPLSRASGLILVLETPKGRGIFASKSIPNKTVIEVCPVIVFDPQENTHYISKSVLQHYTFNWPSPSGTLQALPLGLGSLFNHSSSSHHQNVVWTRNLHTQTITFTACRDIEPKEELCISYGDRGRLWFRDADLNVGQEGKDEWKEDERNGEMEVLRGVSGLLEGHGGR